MDNQNKTYSIILYLIWPFSAFLIEIKNFDTKFGKKLMIAVYAFLGFTVISVGDLQRYEAEFYRNRVISFSQLVGEYVSLQTHKFYNDVVSTAIGTVF